MTKPDADVDIILAKLVLLTRLPELAWEGALWLFGQVTHHTAPLLVVVVATDFIELLTKRTAKV